MRRVSSKIEADFTKDWKLHLLDSLKAMGHNSDPNEDVWPLSLRYFNVKKRYVAPIPRKVLVAKDFICPNELKTGYSLFIQKVKAGIDLKPHMSRGLKKSDKLDPLLFDWDIHHFHLGDQIEQDGYIKRTGPLLFARVTDGEFYVMVIFGHGSWANFDLIKIIHLNWPESISLFTIPGVNKVKRTVPDSDRLRFRNTGLNNIFQMADGTAYFPPGGGYTSTGGSLEVSIAANSMLRKVKSLEDCLKQNTQVWIDEAATNGTTINYPMKFKLTFDFPFFKMTELNSGHVFKRRYQ
jgi:hypothetical protein